jgi:hypothetical protein
MSKQVQLSSEKYIKTKAKELSFFECYASQNWYVSFELVTVIVSKQMPSDNICLAIYLLDKGCLSLKSTNYRFNMTLSEYKDYVSHLMEAEQRPFEVISVEMVHNLIFGAIDYADEYGFSPNKGWIITRHFLNEDLITDEIDSIEFGKDGKPFYISGPYDNMNHILATLKKTAGEGNFDFISHLD